VLPPPPDSPSVPPTAYRAAACSRLTSPLVLSWDPKTDTIAYCTGCSVIIRRLNAPLDAWAYQDHAHPTTVARFSPNGEWVASVDASGCVCVWGRHGDRELKVEFCPLSGYVDDLHWSPAVLLPPQIGH
jgi:WD repeat-containing protein 1 (actin-interacting protein 1)